jgi:esterase/lipase
MKNRKQFFIFLITLLHFYCTAQPKTNIYFFPGQGSDKRIFDSLTIDSSYNKIFIEYSLPAKNTTLKEFAIQLSSQIDTTAGYILIGVSLGGMICTELNDIMNPKKVIIISSAKNRSELPVRYKFQRVIPIYELFPPRMLKGGAKMMQPIVEPDRKKNKATFKNMLNNKNPKYIKRTIKMIVKWDKQSNLKNTYHIHGTKDHTLPIRKIKEANVVINKGSHMMTLTKAKEISEAINSILQETD